MEELIISLVNQFGYFGILFLIAIENVFPPIPSEVILSFGGFLTTYTELKVPLVIIYATLGSVLGAIILYLIGRFFSEERINKILSSKVGRILRIKPSDVAKAQDWFEKKEKLAVFICRFVPIVRSLISIPAGMTKMNFGLFILLTTIGTLIWNTILVLCGYYLGENWSYVVDFFGNYSYLVFVLILLLLVFFLVRILLKKRKNKKNVVKDTSLKEDK